MSDVHLPGARPQPLGGGEQIAGADDRTIDEAGEIARDEDEELGGVGKAVIAQRHPGNDVVGNMIEKDHPEAETSQKVETQIAFDNEKAFALICHVNRSSRLATHELSDAGAVADVAGVLARAGLAVTRLYQVNILATP